MTNKLGVENYYYIFVWKTRLCSSETAMQLPAFATVCSETYYFTIIEYYQIQTVRTKELNIGHVLFLIFEHTPLVCFHFRKIDNEYGISEHFLCLADESILFKHIKTPTTVI